MSPELPVQDARSHAQPSTVAIRIIGCAPDECIVTDRMREPRKTSQTRLGLPALQDLL